MAREKDRTCRTSQKIKNTFGQISQLLVSWEWNRYSRDTLNLLHMSEQQERDHSGTGSAALGMAVAAAIGATLGLIFAPKSGKELRKDLTKQAKQAAKKFKKTRAQVQEIVYSTFGQVNAELEQGYIELRSQILSMIEQLGSKAKLTQKKYDAMVEDVVDLYAKGKKWKDEAVKKLLKDLKAEWKQIKGESK